ncbi:hypothetical protein ACFQPC_16255 [Herminiimonas glaciei]|uniref:Uncharacterized protein n=1 Tax=Herminiimonas glaciei TaxID=523788 RepID=A0ABW2IF95_9BURK
MTKLEAKSPIDSTKSEGLYQNITLNDIQLAGAYYPILIELARHKHCLTYGELVQKVKELHPDNDVVKNAIPTSAGRKLDVVRIFTKERNLPDVTALIINKAEGECGSFYTDHFDPVKTREEVFAFAWDDVSVEFDLFVSKVTVSATPRKQRKESEAAELLYAYYKENRSKLPTSINKKRDFIMALLIEGFSPDEAFLQVNS